MYLASNADPLVGLEESVYVVRENDTSVQVCAAIQDSQGPPETDVEVMFATTTETAEGENNFYMCDSLETFFQDWVLV